VGNLNRVRLTDNVKWDYSYAQRLTDARCGDSPFIRGRDGVPPDSGRAVAGDRYTGFALAPVSLTRLFHPLCSSGRLPGGAQRPTLPTALAVVSMCCGTHQAVREGLRR
jgi:hypothetical protein